MKEGDFRRVATAGALRSWLNRLLRSRFFVCGPQIRKSADPAVAGVTQLVWEEFPVEMGHFPNLLIVIEEGSPLEMAVER